MCLYIYIYIHVNIYIHTYIYIYVYTLWMMGIDTVELVLFHCAFARARLTPMATIIVPVSLESHSSRDRIREQDQKPDWQGQFLTHPGDKSGANRWFLQSTPIQMLPHGGSICRRWTHDLPLGCLQGGLVKWHARLRRRLGGYFAPVGDDGQRLVLIYGTSSLMKRIHVVPRNR